MALIFPKTVVDRFRRSNLQKRWGQEFYDYMELHKCTEPNDVFFCDKLYNCVDENKAKKMVADRTDETQ